VSWCRRATASVAAAPPTDFLILILSLALVLVLRVSIRFSASAMY
jgi:hypothetical protein